MVAVVKGEQRGPVVAEELQPSRQPIELIEIEQQREHPIAELVPLRPQPRMHHRAGIERRVHSAASSTGAQRDAVGLARDPPRPAHAADRFGRREAGLQRVLVKAVAEIAAGKPGVPIALQPPQMLLRLDRRAVEQRMRVVEAAG